MLCFAFLCSWLCLFFPSFDFALPWLTLSRFFWHLSLPFHLVSSPLPFGVFRVFSCASCVFALHVVSWKQAGWERRPPCDNVRAQSATQWTASVHTLHMPKPVITFVFKVLRNGLLRYIFTHTQTCNRLLRCILGSSTI